LGRVPSARSADTGTGIYDHIEHPKTKYANIAHKVLTINESHQKPSHISPRYLQELVDKGIVIGINLDKERIPTFCMSCAKGKPTRKPIPKE